MNLQNPLIRVYHDLITISQGNNARDLQSLFIHASISSQSLPPTPQTSSYAHRGKNLLQKKKKKKEHCIPFHWCKQGSLFHRKKAGEKVVLPRDVTDKNRVEPRVHAREAKEQEDTVEKKTRNTFIDPRGNANES